MILSIGGKRGVGKTLAADYLVKNYGFRKTSFADDLRRKMVYLWGMEPKHFTSEYKEKPFGDMSASPRDLMISLGQHMRYFDPHYWVKTLDLSGKKIVVDDMRFQNEAVYLKDKKAILIRIERYKKYNIYQTEINDISETDLDKYKHDYTIEKMQNISKEDLYGYLNELMRDFNIEHTNREAPSLHN